VAGWLAFVWLTTHWYSWQRTIDLLFGSDMQEYERVARAAPGVPNAPLPSQHAARFVPHYLVGLVSDGLGVGDRTVYYVAAFLLLLAILAVVDRTIAPLSLRLPEYALCIGAVIANPYLFRFLVVAPARLADSVFILGGAVALLGLLRARGSLLVAGLVVATLGRSEAVLPLLVLAPLGVGLSPAWRSRPGRTRAVAGALAVAAPVAAYVVIRIVDATFSVADHPGFMGLTIFGALADLPGSARNIGGQLARTAVGVAGVAALIAGIVVARRRDPRRPGAPFAAWAALAGGAAVALEAVALNPIWLNGSEPLLAALGTAMLAVAAAELAAATRLRLSPGPAALAVGGLVLASLHHRFSSISPVSTPAAYAGLASAGALVTAGAVTWRPLRRTQRERAMPFASSSDR
jgi:hypothetical protein